MIHLGLKKFDPVELASQGNAVLGIRDSGKSYTATWLAEQLFAAGIPFVAIDPIGIWKYLRVSGKGPGIPVVVAGGEHGDLPLTPQSAPAIVRAAMREGVSLVLDLYSMDLSKADWKRIVQESVEILLYENKNHGLRHIFIEEAAEFVPQRVGPDQGRVYAAIEKLARMGGNARLGYTLINQRAEEVNKAVLELCDCLFLHRQKGRNSLTALGKWLDVADATDGREVIKSLPLLGQGECWVWASGTADPARVKVPAKQTYHPDRRAVRGAPSGRDGTTAIDVSAFVAGMSASLEAVLKEAEENDPKVLHQRIAELEQRVADAAPGIDEAEVERRVAEARAEGARLAFERLRGPAREAQSSVNFLCNLLGDTPLPPTSFPARSPLALAEREASEARSVAASRALDRIGKADASLKKVERAVLTALAQHHPTPLALARVAILTGYSGNGGGFRNGLGALRSAGRIQGSDPIEITAAGLKALGPFTPLPRGKKLLEHWCSQLSRAERLVLETVAAEYPRAVPIETVAKRTGYEANGGGFRNAIGKLRTLALVSGRGELVASEHLFK